jgi:hypothetical protein
VDDARVTVAKREADEFSKSSHAVVFILLGVYAVALVSMAFFHASLAWLLVVGFLVGTLIICQTIIECITRLDAGRAYLEQVCHDMNERLVQIHLQMPS